MLLHYAWNSWRSWEWRGAGANPSWAGKGSRSRGFSCSELWGEVTHTEFSASWRFRISSLRTSNQKEERGRIIYKMCKTGWFCWIVRLGRREQLLGAQPQGAAAASLTSNTLRNGLKGPGMTLRGPKIILECPEMILECPKIILKYPEKTLKGPEIILKGNWKRQKTPSLLSLYFLLSCVNLFLIKLNINYFLEHVIQTN